MSCLVLQHSRNGHFLFASVLRGDQEIVSVDGVELPSSCRVSVNWEEMTALQADMMAYQEAVHNELITQQNRHHDQQHDQHPPADDPSHHHGKGRASPAEPTEVTEFLRLAVM